MLTMKAPIQLNTCRPFLSAGTSFGEKIIGNYALMGAHVSPKDLLFLLTAPPELPEDWGGMTTLVANSSVTDLSSVTLEVTNHILNRILLMETPQFTYQDQVYLSSALQKLGITDVVQFIEEVRLTREENQSITSLLQLYHQEAPRLRSAPAAGERAGKQGPVSVTAGAEAPVPPSSTGYYLHERIYSRLQTGEVYQTLQNFSQNFFENGPLGTAPNLQFSEQLKVSSLIALSQQRKEVFEEAPRTLFQLENRYELGELLPPPRTEAQVLSQAAEAALLSTVEQVFVQRLTQNLTPGDLWLDLSSVVRQTAENSVSRFESYHAQTSRFQQVTNADQTLILDLYREETGLLRSYRELRTALDRETRRDLPPTPEGPQTPAMTHLEITQEGDVSETQIVTREGDRVLLENREVTDLTRQMLSGEPRAARPVRPDPGLPEPAPAKKREPTLRELQLISKRAQTVHYLRDIAAWEQELISLVQSGPPPVAQPVAPGPRGPAGTPAPLLVGGTDESSIQEDSGIWPPDHAGTAEGTAPAPQSTGWRETPPTELIYHTETRLEPETSDSVPPSPPQGEAPAPAQPRTAEFAPVPTAPVRPGETAGEITAPGPVHSVSDPAFPLETAGTPLEAPPGQAELSPPRGAEFPPTELVYRVEAAPAPDPEEARQIITSEPKQSGQPVPPTSETGTAPASPPVQTREEPPRPKPVGPRPPLYFFPPRKEKAEQGDAGAPEAPRTHPGEVRDPAALVHRVSEISGGPEPEAVPHTESLTGRESTPNATPATPTPLEAATFTGVPLIPGSGGGAPPVPEQPPAPAELVYRRAEESPSEAGEPPPHAPGPGAPDTVTTPGSLTTLEREVSTLLRETVSTPPDRFSQPGTQAPVPTALTHRTGETPSESAPLPTSPATVSGREAAGPAPSREGADGPPSLRGPGAPPSGPAPLIPRQDPQAAPPAELIYRTDVTLAGESPDGVPPSQPTDRREAVPQAGVSAPGGGDTVPPIREVPFHISPPAPPQTGVQPPAPAALVHPVEEQAAERTYPTDSAAPPAQAAPPAKPGVVPTSPLQSPPASTGQSPTPDSTGTTELLREVLKDLLPRRESPPPPADTPARPPEPVPPLPPEALMLLAQTPAGEEARNELVIKELTELDRRNRTFQERLTEVRQRSETRPARGVPDRARTMADALRALESPDQVMRELLASPPQPRDTAPQPAELEFLLGNADETTKAIYESALLYEKDPQAALRQGLIRPGSQSALNAESTRREREETLLLHQLETLQAPPAGEASAASPLRPFLAEGAVRTEIPAAQTADTRMPLSFVHKSASDTFTEELLERLEEQRLHSVQPQTITEQVQRREVRETETTEMTRKLAAQTTEDITALINRTLSKQMGAISDKVYQQMEKRLQAERYRRGRF